MMPEIKEDKYNERGGATCQSPTQMTPGGGGDEDTPVAVRAHKNVTATSSTSTVTFAPSYSAPTSGPTSGLQTPSTPRIDISCASSSTPPSDESASEKELFQGGLGLAFHEEAVDDLRSSTEELDLGEEEISSEEERRRKRLEEQEMREQDIYRRSSHPANIFSRKASVPAAPPPPQDQDDNFQRKPSAHSLFLEGLLNRPCRHASFGHADYMRPGAVSSLSTHSAGMCHYIILLVINRIGSFARISLSFPKTTNNVRVNFKIILNEMGFVCVIPVRSWLVVLPSFPMTRHQISMFMYTDKTVSFQLFDKKHFLSLFVQDLVIVHAHAPRLHTNSCLKLHSVEASQFQLKAWIKGHPPKILAPAVLQLLPLQLVLQQPQLPINTLHQLPPPVSQLVFNHILNQSLHSDLQQSHQQPQIDLMIVC